MKLAIGFSSKDQVELTDQTLNRLCETPAEFDIYWGDGSLTDEGLKFFADHRDCAFHSDRVIGGADASIAWKLSEMLKHPYTHVGLLENDVLLLPDWFDDTIALFDKGKVVGLEVGAVSPRSYVDRVLIQRDGVAVMHNLGAGMVIFTREAAELALRSFRTHWWPDNRKLFAQLSGIDLATYAAFAGREQWVTTDWGWDAQLARHGLASLALTPAKCRMIGQKIPLEQQGLRLTADGDCSERNDNNAMDRYQENLAWIREGNWKAKQPSIIHREGDGMLFFPHQLGYLAGAESWQGTMELQWNQGFGPFAYRAGPGGASLSVRISGSCSFFASGGKDGARVAITDTRSGFNFAPELPTDQGPVAMQVPGGPISRRITCELAEGAVFYGLWTTDSQLLDTTFKFDWAQLPGAK